MNKRWILALAMVLCLCLLTACQTSEPERFTVKTAGSTTGAATQNQGGMPADEPEWDDNYDPRVEEDNYLGGDDWAYEIPVPPTATPTAAPTIRGEYAGATPVPLDPIDKPTPTAVPPLPEFNYRTYEATKLGLSFDGPVGWVVDDKDSNYYVIQNPAGDEKMYHATLTVYAGKVNRQYSESDLKTEVKSMLNAIGTSSMVADFEPSNTASRDLLKSKGVYANYDAVLEDGNVISGRVHACCVEKVLYTVHISAPKDYWNSYKDGVYDKLRDTIKVTK